MLPAAALMLACRHHCAALQEGAGEPVRRGVLVTGDWALARVCAHP